MKKQLYIATLLPLLVGGIIYIGLRDTNLVMFSWYDTLHLSWLTDGVRAFVQNKISGHAPGWIIYSFPGGLYMLSSVSLLLLIWHNEITPTSAIWIFMLPVLGTVSEIFQWSGHFPGTHSHTDVIFYILGTAGAVISFRYSDPLDTSSKKSYSWYRHVISAIVILFYCILAFGADVVGSPLGELIDMVMGSKWAGY